MTKKILLLVSILLVAVMAITIFAGCESFKNTKFAMDSATSSQSNGGSVVLHGDYIYFINGFSDVLDEYKENWFGNVKKGAIMRLKKDDTDMANVEVIVPKAVYSTASNTGFSIYGDYLYYVSSSSDDNRDGTIDTSTLLFMRTRLDGQDTSTILKVESGLSTQYKYTPKGLLYVSDGNVYFKSTEGKIKTKDQGKVVASEVSNIVFPVSESYTKGEESIADYFFYTKSSEVTGDYTNELYVSSADGSYQKKLIDKNTFTSDPLSDVKNAFSVSVIATKNLGDSLAVIYTKSYYSSTGSSSTSAGTYMYVFNDKTFNFDKANERKVSVESLSSLTIVDANSVLCASSTLAYYTDNGGDTFDMKSFTTEYGKIDSATVVGVHDGYVYLIMSNVFKRIKLDMSTNIEAIGADKVHVKFINPELVVDGENAYLFYFNDSYSDYLYRIDLGSYNKADQSIDNILFGEKTQEDIDAENK